MGASALAEGSDDASTIAHRLNWPVNKSAIRELKLEGVVGCEIYDAYDERVLDGLSIGVARLKGGSLIVGSEPEALDKVLDKCVASAAPPGTLAILMVSFSRYAGLRVLTQQDISMGVGVDLLKKAGRQFAAPSISVEQGARVVRFFALAPDGSSLIEVKGRIGKQVTIESKAL